MRTEDEWRDLEMAEREEALIQIAKDLRGMKDTRHIRNSTLERFAVRVEALVEKKR
jgi:hypothetical protein